MSWLRQLFHPSGRSTAISPRRSGSTSPKKSKHSWPSGMSREDAEYAARREFGNVARIEESGHEPWMWPRAGKHPR